MWLLGCSTSKGQRGLLAQNTCPVLEWVPLRGEDISRILEPPRVFFKGVPWGQCKPSRMPVNAMIAWNWLCSVQFVFKL